MQHPRPPQTSWKKLHFDEIGRRSLRTGKTGMPGFRWQPVSVWKTPAPADGF